MADRPVWKGTLKIALVQIPIKVYPATSSADGVSFNQLHKTCTTRIKQKTVCPHCEIEVPHADLVKGFEFEKGKFVIMLPEELEAIAPPSTRVIELTQVAPAVQLEPRMVDRSYYLQPDGPLAAEAFAVVREALIGLVGTGKLAIYGREYLVAVGTEPRNSALLLYTLHHAAEMRPIEAREGPPVLVVYSQVRMARALLTRLRRPLDLADFTDQYQAELRQLIAAKIAGQEYVIPPIPEPVPIGNLRQALEQSLLAVSQGTRIRPKTPVTTKAMRQGRKLRESA